MSSLLSFVAGLVTAYLLGRVYGRLLDGIDFIRLGVWLLIVAPLILLTGLFLRDTVVGSGILYLSAFIAGALFLVPMKLLIVFWLLWWNPEKYKERHMKEWSRRKALETSIEKEI